MEFADQWPEVRPSLEDRLRQADGDGQPTWLINPKKFYPGQDEIGV